MLVQGLETEMAAHCSIQTSRSFFVVYFKYVSVYMLIPNSQFIIPSPPFLFGNHRFVFYVCESLSSTK